MNEKSTDTSKSRGHKSQSRSASLAQALGLSSVLRALRQWRLPWDVDNAVRAKKQKIHTQPPCQWAVRFLDRQNFQQTEQPWFCLQRSTLSGRQAHWATPPLVEGPDVACDLWCARTPGWSSPSTASTSPKICKSRPARTCFHCRRNKRRWMFDCSLWRERWSCTASSACARRSRTGRRSARLRSATRFACRSECRRAPRFRPSSTSRSPTPEGCSWR